MSGLVPKGSVADPDPYGMFFGLPDPDPLVRGTDPDRDQAKIVRKTCCFVTSL